MPTPGVRTRRIIGVGLCGAALVAGAAGCGGATSDAPTGWSAPANLGTANDLRADIAPDGTSVVTWQAALPGETAQRGLVVSSGDKRGRFSRPRKLVRTQTGKWAVAAAPHGGFLVVWQGVGGLYAAVRAHLGARVTIRRVASSPVRTRGTLEAVTDPRGGWVIADAQERLLGENSTAQRVRTLSLDSSGRPVGAPQALGYGFFGRRGQSTDLTIDAAGRALLAFTRVAPPLPAGTLPSDNTPVINPIMVATRPHGQRFAAPAALPTQAKTGLEDAQTAVGADGNALVSATQPLNCGESGCFGSPVLSLLAPDERPRALVGPPLRHANRAFGPGAAFTADGRGVLVFMLKNGPDPFNNAAPVRAATFGANGKIGPVQTLSASHGSLPYVVGIEGGGALAVWENGDGFGAALANPDGHFRPTAAPKGSPPQPLCCPARTLASAGRWVLQAWTDANSRARATVRRF